LKFIRSLNALQPFHPVIFHHGTPVASMLVEFPTRQSVKGVSYEAQQDIFVRVSCNHTLRRWRIGAAKLAVKQLAEKKIAELPAGRWD
jgi:hypothetical protein